MCYCGDHPCGCPAGSMQRHEGLWTPYDAQNVCTLTAAFQINQPASRHSGSSRRGRYGKLFMATPMHSTQLRIGGRWRVARTLVKSGLRHIASAYRPLHSFVVHVERSFDLYSPPRRWRAEITKRPVNGPTLYCRVSVVGAEDDQLGLCLVLQAAWNLIQCE